MSSATRLRLFYFLYYGSIGVSLPYLAPYLKGLGFSGNQIGTVQMLAPLVSAPAALAWAAIADRLGAPTRALRLASLWALAAIAFLPFARTPVTVGLVLLIQALAASSLVPLVDSVSIEWALQQPGRSYARLRLFGSVGFIVLAQILGLVLAARGDRLGDILIPLSVVVCVAGYALAAWQLPAIRLEGDRAHWADVVALLHDRRLLVLLVFCAVHWGACAPFHLLFGVFVRENGLSSRVTGAGMAVGVGAEVLALLIFPRLRGWCSTPAILTVAFAGTSLRWLLLSVSQGAWPIVSLQIFHGLTFGLFWGSAIDRMSELVPSRLRATGQALFSAVVFAAGNAVGYQLSGIGFDHYGSVYRLYVWASLVELAPFGAAGAIWWRGRTRRSEA